MENNRKVCSICGATLESGQEYCVACGNKDISKTKSSKFSPSIILNIIMVICFILSMSMYSKGQDKVNNYYNSENYPSLNENAYVGGDAYNYIINANYATGYYVLSTGFMLAGTMCGCTGLILNKKDNQ